jgi:hypothetical protein
MPKGLRRIAHQQNPALAHSAEKGRGEHPPEIAVRPEQDEVKHRHPEGEGNSRNIVVADDDQIDEQRPHRVEGLLEADRVLPKKITAERTELLRRQIAPIRLRDQPRHHHQRIGRVMDDLLPAHRGEEAGPQKTKRERQREQHTLKHEQNGMQAALAL